MIRSIVVACIAMAPALRLASQEIPDTPSSRLVKASDEEQRRAVKAALDGGLSPELYENVGRVIRIRSSMALPMLTEKIVEVMTSKDPRECFTVEGIDVKKFVDRASWTIAQTGDEHALKEIARLIKLDRDRFGALVSVALVNSMDRGNPFTVAYRGMTIGDAELGTRIAGWVEARLSVDPNERKRAEAAAHRLGTPIAPAPSDVMKRLWAEAMLTEYGKIPTEGQLLADPILSQLSAEKRLSTASDMCTRAAETAKVRAR